MTEVMNYSPLIGKPSPWGLKRGKDFLDSIFKYSGLYEDEPVPDQFPRKIRLLVNSLRSQGDSESSKKYKDLFNRYYDCPEYPKTSANLIDYFKFFFQLVLNTNSKEGCYELQILIHFSRGDNTLKTNIINHLSRKRRIILENERLLISKVNADLKNGHSLVIIDSNGRANVKYSNYSKRKKIRIRKNNYHNNNNNNNNNVNKNNNNNRIRKIRSPPSPSSPPANKRRVSHLTKK